MTRSPSTEEVIHRLAAAQRGLVTRRQLKDAGVSEQALHRRIRHGYVRRCYRGVYVVGPVEDARAAELAAVLACGEGAVISHISAAALWRLPGFPGGAPFHVTAPADRRHPGIRLHRRRLEQHEITGVDEVPVTTVAVTLLDLAAAIEGHALERVVAHAIRLNLCTREELDGLVSRQPGRRGATRLRRLVVHDQLAFTRSEAEQRFLDLIRRAQLPTPRVNAMLSGYEVDFFWPAERLAVEIDGFAFHSSAARFESDRRRDAVLAAAGVAVIRVTWRQLTTCPEALLVRLAQVLARRSRGA